MSQTPELFPAVPFENETIVRNDSSFIDACKAKVADAAEKFGWRFETSILTRSEKWGLVWRADFRIKKPIGGEKTDQSRHMLARARRNRNPPSSYLWPAN